MIKIKVSIPGFGGNLNISQYVGNDDGVWGMPGSMLMILVLMKLIIGLLLMIYGIQ